MKIKEIKTDKEFAAILPLIQMQNPKITPAIFKKRLKAMRAAGYRCIAMMEDTKIMGIAGFWTSIKFWCGSYIEPDNVIVDETCRGKGIGQKLMKWIENEGKNLGCDMTLLYSYTNSHKTHAFYFREGFIIRGYGFTKDLN